MRLIDADELEGHLKADDELYGYLKAPGTDDNSLYSVDDIVRAIQKAPTVSSVSTPDYQHVKTRDELLTADLGDLTDEEKERRARAKAIPAAVVEACKSEYSRLRGEVIEREAKMDAIDRFLTGEKIAGYHDEHEPAQ